MSDKQFKDAFRMTPSQLLQLKEKNLVVLSIYERQPEKWRGCEHMRSLIEAEGTISGGLRNQHLFSSIDDSFMTETESTIKRFTKIADASSHAVQDHFGFSLKENRASIVRALGFRFQFLKVRYPKFDLCDRFESDIKAGRIRDAFERLNFYHSIFTKDLTGSEGGDYAECSTIDFTRGNFLDDRFTPYHPDNIPGTGGKELWEWLARELSSTRLGGKHSVSEEIDVSCLLDRIVTRDNFEKDKVYLTQGIERLTDDLNSANIDRSSLQSTLVEVRNYVIAQRDEMDTIDDQILKWADISTYAGFATTFLAFAFDPYFLQAGAGALLFLSGKIVRGIRKYDLPDSLIMRPYRHHKLFITMDNIHHESIHGHL